MNSQRVCMRASVFGPVRGVACCVVLGCLSGLLVGCGEDAPTAPRGSVSGKVTLDGKPVADAEISFTPLDILGGKPAVSRISNGQYTISAMSGPAVGKNQVQIIATDNSIPEQYNASSSLEVNIKSGSNSHDFELTSKGE